MADRKDILIQETAIAGASGTTVGRTIRVAGCDEVSVGLTVTVTAATLQGTFIIGGTNDDTRAWEGVATLPALTSGTNSVLPTGITYSTGVFTLNNPAIGTSEVVVTFTSVPKYIRPALTVASGGGTVAISATVSAWSS